MKQKMLLVLNWKSNPKTRDEAVKLAEGIPDSKEDREPQIIIAPPFLYLDAVRASIAKHTTPILLGAQDIMPSFTKDSVDTEGSAGRLESKHAAVLTGEVSAAMLGDVGVSHVLVGHSERRYVLGEDDALINEKMRAALNGGIVPILCVGEREKTNVSQAVQESINQLSLALEGIAAKQIIVAYEPVWAIGGDKVIEPAYAAGVISGIKKYLATADLSDPILVLYGGSVNCENITSLLVFNEIDGFLVGSGSLSVDAISCIINKILNKN